MSTVTAGAGPLDVYQFNGWSFRPVLSAEACWRHAEDARYCTMMLRAYRSFATSSLIAAHCLAIDLGRQLELDRDPKFFLITHVPQPIYRGTISGNPRFSKGFNMVRFMKGLSEQRFRELYGSEKRCRAALFALRWPDGFVCRRRAAATPDQQFRRSCAHWSKRASCRN